MIKDSGICLKDHVVLSDLILSCTRRYWSWFLDVINILPKQNAPWEARNKNSIATEAREASCGLSPHPHLPTTLSTSPHPTPVLGDGICKCECWVCSGKFVQGQVFPEHKSPGNSFLPTPNPNPVVQFSKCIIAASSAQWFISWDAGPAPPSLVKTSLPGWVLPVPLWPWVPRALGMPAAASKGSTYPVVCRETEDSETGTSEDAGPLENPLCGSQGMYKSSIWTEIRFQNIFEFVSWQTGGPSWGPGWWEVCTHVGLRLPLNISGLLRPRCPSSRLPSWPGPAGT